MTVAEIANASASDLSELIQASDPHAAKILVLCGVAPDTTDEFNQIVFEYLKAHADIGDQSVTLEMERCGHAGYALGVAVGLRLAGGAR